MRSRAPTSARLPVGEACELGLDIVEIARVRRVAKKAPRFLTRVFTPEETAYCRTQANPWQHFAVRFAAKEAVWKALGRLDLTLKDISVSRTPRGKPGVLIKGRKTPEVRLSLSHCEAYAAAVALHVKA
ncbi:MAG: holo-ACP synthase [Elusimicrobia bacterium]|nr:holo-ACP synthase [Elusimicrobiota bacterium]